MRGSVTPRLWTPPLRPLTPETSYGFDVVAFARYVLLAPFDPWEEWAVIHAGEMLPDGRPRFRHILIMVARQNGKTHLCVVLSLYWMFVDQWPMTLGTSTKLDYARISWEKAVNLMRATKSLRALMPARGGIRRTNGEQEMKSILNTSYKIGAANDDGGRSLSIDRLIQDELRQHKSYAAWDAGVGAMSARPYAQNFCLSNAGDDTSVVLNERREMALKFVKWWERNGTADVAEMITSGQLPPGMPNFRNGILEWSAEEDADPRDMRALAQANPNLGVVGWDGALRMDPQEKYLEACAAVEKGGRTLTGFQTEFMCIRVPMLDPAVDAAAWKACGGDADLMAAPRVAWCLDVAPDLEHAILVACALDDGVAVLDVVDAWAGPAAVPDMLADLPDLVADGKPVSLGWFPGGPAAAAAGRLKDRAAKDRHFAWPPPWLEVVEIREETAAVCMGFAVEVRAYLVRHGNDELLTTHVTGADKLMTGDRWRFARGVDAAHVNGAYAAAGAVHLARTMPAAPGPIRLVGLED